MQDSAFPQAHRVRRRLERPLCSHPLARRGGGVNGPWTALHGAPRAPDPSCLWIW